jgi:S-(hydroxymethyl)glutathione dehydrogenase/alcohol dehydrogenase
VAVVGCGPLGLSAVQGARIGGASTIIGIDPIRARRDIAMKVGATHVLDPNVEGDKLIERVRALTAGPTNRAWSGGRDSGGRRSGAGADLVVEAAGAEFVRPRLEQGPDPSGILPMQQAYQMASAGGHVITTGLVRGTITLPAFLFAIGGVTHSGGQAGGANPMRDIPRFVEMLHAGRYDAKTHSSYQSHSVIVIEEGTDSAGRFAFCIGGNESDSVRRSTVRLDKNGFIKQRAGNSFIALVKNLK